MFEDRRDISCFREVIKTVETAHRVKIVPANLSIDRQREGF
jgi:hypothetical protein